MLTAIAVQVMLVTQGGCLVGTTAQCSLPGCLQGERECTGAGWTPCGCVVPDCNDANPCTIDSWNGIDCVHTPNTGAACDDGNPCTTNDVCTSTGTCAGTIAVGLACSEGTLLVHRPANPLLLDAVLRYRDQVYRRVGVVLPVRSPNG